MDITQKLQELKNHFISIGLPSYTYTVPQNTSYSSYTKSAQDIYCLEICLTPASSNTSKLYSVIQVFDKAHQNLTMAFFLQRDSMTLEAQESTPHFTLEGDKNFSLKVLPKLYDAFNEFDPKAKNQSLLIQSYNVNLSLIDLILATAYSIRLLNFKKFGQMAQIAVDYGHWLIRLIAKLMVPLNKLTKDVYNIPQTSQLSTIRFPVTKTLSTASGTVHYINTNTTALDKGFAIAYQYIS